MALLGNYSVLNKDPGKSYAGTTRNDAADLRKSGATRCMYIGQANLSQLDGIQRGYLPPYSQVIPIKPGGMASVNNLLGSGITNAANLAGGLNGVSAITGTGAVNNANINALGNIIGALTGTGTISAADLRAIAVIASALAGSGVISNAAGALVVSILSNLTGTGTINASAAGALYATADLAGTGTVSAQVYSLLQAVASLSGSGVVSNANINAIGNQVSALAGSGSITNANLQALANLIIALSGNGTVSAADLRALATITADITPYTVLSPESLASALWNSTTTSYNNPGTMGEKLNSAGSASNPWTTVIEGTYTAEEVMRILLSVAAGKTHIVDHGGGVATVTFRDQADTRDRITADMDGSERTTTTLDPT